MSYGGSYYGGSYYGQVEERLVELPTKPGVATPHQLTGESKPTQRTGLSTPTQKTGGA